MSGSGLRSTAFFVKPPGPRSEIATPLRPTLVIAAVRSATSCVKSGNTTFDRCWPLIEYGW